MSTKSKLSKVLEYLIKNDEEKAKELLHQVFIEKARAIHEEMMSHDDDMEEEIGGTGDMGKDFENDINARGKRDAHADAVDSRIREMENEIDFEETMSEDDDTTEFNATTDDEDELELGDDGDEMDMDVDTTVDNDDDEHADHDAIMTKVGDLETALAELKAEFEKLEAEEHGESGNDADGEEGDEEGDEEEESWDLDEDFDDIAESLDLEVVTKDMEKSVPAKDVGAANSGMSDGNKARSPVPPSQTSRFGAKPVETGKGPTHNGYNIEKAPNSSMEALKIADPDMKADNRRKTSTTGTSKMSKEGNKPNAALNTTAKQFGTDTVGKMSPLSKGGQNLK